MHFEKVKNQNLSNSKKLSGLLNSLRIKATLRKIPLIAPLLFQPFACEGRISPCTLHATTVHAFRAHQGRIYILGCWKKITSHTDKLIQGIKRIKQ